MDAAPKPIIQGPKSRQHPDTESNVSAPRLALKRGVHAAMYADELILLDLNQNKYSGLDASSSACLLERLGSEQSTILHLADGANGCRALLDALLAQGLTEWRTEATTGPQTLGEPPKPGGLTVCAWRPELGAVRASSGQSLRNRHLTSALFALATVEWTLRRHNLAGLIARIERRAAHRPTNQPAADTATVTAVHHAIQRARRWYPRPTNCLVGSAALQLLLYRCGITTQFVIGAQKYPFYAHAWVEWDGSVINDSQEVAEYLAVLLRAPAAIAHL